MAQFILITGISSGLGKRMIELLSQEDYHIIGTLRRQEEISIFSKTFPAHHFIEMDVTDSNSVSKAFQKIRLILHGNALFALINNAGQAISGPIAYLPLNDWEYQIRVNVLGLVHCIKEAYPLLLLGNQNARIINIGSVSGIFGSPFIGAYVSSKYALEGLTDSLRRESMLLGIKVILFQLGPIKTNIWLKNQGLAEKYADTVFGEILKKSDQEIEKYFENAFPVEIIDKPLLHALKNKKPKTRYLIHKSPRLLSFAAKFLPDSFVDKLIYRRIMAKSKKQK